MYNVENMSLECRPKCDISNCGNCPLGSYEFSTKEKKDIDMIEKGLTLTDNVWTAKYLWIKHPSPLPNNRRAMNIETRLMKVSSHARTCQRQIEDTLEEGVAKKLDDKDLMMGQCTMLVHTKVSNKSLPQHSVELFSMHPRTIKAMY